MISPLNTVKLGFSSLLVTLGNPTHSRAGGIPLLFFFVVIEAHIIFAYQIFHFPQTQAALPHSLAVNGVSVKVEIQRNHSRKQCHPLIPGY